MLIARTSLPRLENSHVRVGFDEVQEARDTSVDRGPAETASQRELVAKNADLGSASVGLDDHQRPSLVALTWGAVGWAGANIGGRDEGWVADGARQIGDDRRLEGSQELRGNGLSGASLCSSPSVG